MKDRSRLWTAGCIGPLLVAQGVAVLVLTWAAAGVAMIFASGQTAEEKSRNVGDLWGYATGLGLAMIAAGLLVMLFAGILWLVRKAGVAQSKEDHPAR